MRPLRSVVSLRHIDPYRLETDRPIRTNGTIREGGEILEFLEEPLEEEERFWREHRREIENELRQAAIAESPIVRKVHGVRFLSGSKGRGRKRGHPQVVTLIRYGPDHGWRFWSGGDHSQNGRLPWDNWATEIFGPDSCDLILNQGQAPGDYLRQEISRLLQLSGGKF